MIINEEETMNFEERCGDMGGVGVKEEEIEIR